MKKNDIGAIILNWLKGFFTKNLALKIVSLLFAMLIWGYVMVEVNPKRDHNGRSYKLFRRKLAA